MSLPVPTEDVEQMQLVQWLEDKGYKFTAIPNSTYTTSWKQKLKNRDMGLRAGFPDILIVVEDRLIAIEMKRTKGGRVTPEQEDWIFALNQAGVQARVCRGFVQAKQFVEAVAAERLIYTISRVGKSEAAA